MQPQTRYSPGSSTVTFSQRTAVGVLTFQPGLQSSSARKGAGRAASMLAAGDDASHHPADSFAYR
jgi:hypothetical protein